MSTRTGGFKIRRVGAKCWQYRCKHVRDRNRCTICKTQQQSPPPAPPHSPQPPPHGLPPPGESAPALPSSPAHSEGEGLCAPLPRRSPRLLESGGKTGGKIGGSRDAATPLGTSTQPVPSDPPPQQGREQGHEEDNDTLPLWRELPGDTRLLTPSTLAQVFSPGGGGVEQYSVTNDLPTLPLLPRRSPRQLPGSGGKTGGTWGRVGHTTLPPVMRQSEVSRNAIALIIYFVLLRVSHTSHAHTP